uniref:BPTI/Kunitz inhibitor domain-containing protein n=1 Tax=Timema cristinae TaxID=61476 RepID=A0A7R9DNE7_TIMCR|nr:unnamed protein product [Timema cristinae]
MDGCTKNTRRRSIYCDIGVVRYYYDNTSQKCESYAVLTCSDSDICNYKTFEDCMKNCHH